MAYLQIDLTTEDGCDIRLHRFAMKVHPHTSPVLLVHGYAANGRMWNPPTQEGHLAAYLARAGYTVYAIDLRFRNGKPSRDWNCDDYVLFDVPAALKHIFADTGKQACHWVGHSMGGLLGYMYQALNGSRRIASQTVLGSPGFVGAGSHAHLVKLSKAVIKLASFAIDSGRLDLLPAQLMNNLVKMSFFAANPKDPAIKRLPFEDLDPRDFLGNVAYGESMQMMYLASKKGLTSPRFKFNYKDLTEHIKAPLLAFAGDRDFIVPPKVVKKGFEAAGSSEKKYLRLGRRRGCQTSYGHLDLIMGPHTHSEVWPHILGWLMKHEARTQPHPKQPQQQLRLYQSPP